MPVGRLIGLFCIHDRNKKHVKMYVFTPGRVTHITYLGYVNRLMVIFTILTKSMVCL